MTVLCRVRRLARSLSFAVLGLGVALGAAACGGGEEEAADAGAAAESSPAPVLGADDGRVQLTEDVAQTIGAGGEEGASLLLTGYEEGEAPAVLISVEEGSGETAEYTLELGDTFDVDGASWRVSEIGFSDSGSMPGSATLTKEE
ncbi:hypothetical protein HDA32_001527 [Spinactinospora alkalitolerans]|uniref:Lipoprotein n=1 Tax=Spinactinospora alkalitolerans TaxID=687207 RepID=A0A852TSZ5_9ACTN|nr:DUF6406 domain-containing protein [Spinactinospora alkalitolerans]NYE46407.1 hypothetical protein [Spinactinospora alkalitolerans]